MQAQRRRARNDADEKAADDSEDADDGSIITEAVKIYKQGGFSAFYVGVLPDTTKTLLDSFLFFLAYNFLQQSRQQAHVRSGTTKNPKRLSIAEELLVGMGAGAISRFVTTPLQTVVTRQQAFNSVNSSAKNISTLETAQRLFKKRGLAAFWAAYPYNVILTINPSLTFLLHKFLLHVTIPRSKRDHPPAAATFIIAAIAKALASFVTYPVTVAKTRAQLSGDSEPTDKSKTSQTGLRDLPIMAYPPFSVFAAVYDITVEEGPAGLYRGVSGELLKGFLGHGLTMAMKARIHSLVIQSYFLLLQKSKELHIEEAGERVADAAHHFADVGRSVFELSRAGTEVLSDEIEELGDILEEVLRGK